MGDCEVYTLLFGCKSMQVARQEHVESSKVKPVTKREEDVLSGSGALADINWLPVYICSCSA